MVTKKISIAMVRQSLTEYLDVLLYGRNIIGSSSEIFGVFGKMFGNDCLTLLQLFENLKKVYGNLRKIVKKVVISMFIS